MVKLRATNHGEGSAGDGATVHVHDAFRGYTYSHHKARPSQANVPVGNTLTLALKGWGESPTTTEALPSTTSAEGRAKPERTEKGALAAWVPTTPMTAPALVMLVATGAPGTPQDPTGA